jgi:branched-subunit amino acid transport protein
VNFFGLILGVCVLVLIALFHIIVVKFEYYVGAKFWPVFLVAGFVCIVLSFITKSNFLSGILGIAGIFLFWSIRELIEQKERVEKGWFPKNPDRQ